MESGLNDEIATPFVNLFLAGVAAEEVAHSGGVGAAVVKMVVGVGVGNGVGYWPPRCCVTPMPGGGVRPRSVRLQSWVWRCSPIQQRSRGAGTGSWRRLPTAWRSAPSCRPRGRDPRLHRRCRRAAVVACLVLARRHDDRARVRTSRMARRGLRPAGADRGADGANRGGARGNGPGPRDDLVRRLVRSTGAGVRGVALIAVDSLDTASGNRVLPAVVLPVLLSVVAHGVTASPLAVRYGAHAAGLHPQHPEHMASPPRSLAGGRRHASPVAGQQR